MHALTRGPAQLTPSHPGAVACSRPPPALAAAARPGCRPQVRLQVQRQLAQALFKLSVEFRKQETRFLNKMEAQKGLAAGSSIGLVEDEGPGGGGASAGDPGFTESQLMKVGGWGGGSKQGWPLQVLLAARVWVR